MKKLISHKAQLILTICADKAESSTPIYLSDEIIDYSLKNDCYGPVGTFLHRYFDIALTSWLTVVMSPAFLTDSLDDLVMCGRLAEEGELRNQRYSITARGRRTLRVIENWKARTKARASAESAQVA